MRKRGREAWLDDIRASQRNVVFPDTVQNEGRFWRNILSGKGRFTITQVVGIGLMYLTMGGVIGIAVYQKVHNSSATGSLFNRLVTNFGDWIVLFSIFGVLFLLSLESSPCAKYSYKSEPSGQRVKQESERESKPY